MLTSMSRADVMDVYGLTVADLIDAPVCDDCGDEISAYACNPEDGCQAVDPNASLADVLDRVPFDALAPTSSAVVLVA